MAKKKIVVKKAKIIKKPLKSTGTKKPEATTKVQTFNTFQKPTTVIREFAQPPRTAFVQKSKPISKEQAIKPILTSLKHQEALVKEIKEKEQQLEKETKQTEGFFARASSWLSFDGASKIVDAAMSLNNTAKGLAGNLQGIGDMAKNAQNSVWGQLATKVIGGDKIEKGLGLLGTATNLINTYSI